MYYVYTYILVILSNHDLLNPALLVLLPFSPSGDGDGTRSARSRSRGFSSKPTARATYTPEGTARALGCAHGIPRMKPPIAYPHNTVLDFSLFVGA